MERVPGGWVYVVPVGAVVHCPKGTKIPVGAKCFMKSTEASHVYCMEQAAEPTPEEREARPRVHHRRETYEQMVL